MPETIRSEQEPPRCGRTRAQGEAAAPFRAAEESSLAAPAPPDSAGIRPTVARALWDHGWVAVRVQRQ
jgi:hypothetical protein